MNVRRCTTCGAAETYWSDEEYPYNPCYEATLFREVMAEVDRRTFTLVYVGYDDRLSEDQVAALVRGDDFDDPAWGTYDDWTSEVQWQSAIEARQALVREAQQTLYRRHQREDEEWLETSLTDEHEEEVDEAIRERDDSDPLSGLIDNTHSVALRVPLGEVPRDDDGEVDVGALIGGVLHQPGMVEALRPTVEGILAESYDLYLEAFLVAYVRLDRSWLFAAPETPVTFETPHLWLSNPYAGNGWCDELPGVSLTVLREQLRTDEDAPGYSWEDVAGPVWSAFASEVSVATVETSTAP